MWWSLILAKAIGKLKECDLLVVGEKHWKASLFLVRESFVKAKSDSKTFSNSYSLRFIDSVRLMNDSLDSLVCNLTRNLYNTKYKHCMECKDCKNVKSVEILALNGEKNYQIIVKIVTKYMATVNAVLN